MNESAARGNSKMNIRPLILIEKICTEGKLKIVYCLRVLVKDNGKTTNNATE